MIEDKPTEDLQDDITDDDFKHPLSQPSENETIEFFKNKVEEQAHQLKQQRFILWFLTAVVAIFLVGSVVSDTVQAERAKKGAITQQQ